MKKLLIVLCVLALICGGWYFASPWLAMKGIADAAQAGDNAALEKRIDFPALRASASDQISEATRRRVGQGGALERVGGAVAARIGREVSQRAMTPETIGNVVILGSFAAGFVPERLRGQEVDWDVSREGFDHFRAAGTFEDGSPGPVLIFRRDGLGWKMTGFELPDW